MNGLEIQHEMVKERTQRYVVEAETRRLAKLTKTNTPTLRARVARRLFEISVRIEHDATWKVVWEKLEAPKHS